MQARELDLSDLTPSRNVREGLDIAELAESIREHGVLQPIRVRPADRGRYQIIAGHRRVAACRAVGRTTVPAIIADESDTSAAVQTIVENLQREDLTPQELSRGIRELQTAYNLPIDEIGRVISKSPTQVRAYIRLAHLPDDVLDLLESGEGRTHEVQGLARRHVRELTKSVPVQHDSPEMDDRVREAARHIRDLDDELQKRGTRINAHQADMIGRKVTSGQLSMSEAVDFVLANPERYRYSQTASSAEEVEAKTAETYQALQRELTVAISKLRPEIASAFTSAERHHLLMSLDPAIERLKTYQAALNGMPAAKQDATPTLLRRVE